MVAINLPKGTLGRNVSFILKKLHRNLGLCTFHLVGSWTMYTEAIKHHFDLRIRMQRWQVPALHK